MQANEHISNLQDIRQRARRNIRDGAVTSDYDTDVQTIVSLLNDALATEIVCALRYKRHHYMATGINARIAAQEFGEHADEEWQHADSLAARIVQLGGEPDFSPKNLVARSHADYVEATNLEEMISENLVAERIAIETYREIIRFIGNADPTTRRILEDILIVEEEHADELTDLLDEQPVLRPENTSTGNQRRIR